MAARGGDAVRNIDARLGGVAGLAGITGAQTWVLVIFVHIIAAASLALVRVLQRGTARGLSLPMGGGLLRGRVGLRSSGIPFLARGIARFGLESVDLHGVGAFGRRGGSGGGGSSGTSLAFVAAGVGW